MSRTPQQQIEIPIKLQELARQIFKVERDFKSIESSIINQQVAMANIAEDLNDLKQEFNKLVQGEQREQEQLKKVEEKYEQAKEKKDEPAPQ